MTPLEELQAAHKRLSELRVGEEWSADLRGETWGITSKSRVWWVALELEERADADLIVTLHRTIDAQLLILSRIIDRSAPVAAADAMGQMYYWSSSAPNDALRLARAINREAS